MLNGRTPSVDDLVALPYTAAVIHELMRLYPPVYVIGREATTELELGGYRVKRGYTVLMSQWVNHRDPEVLSRSGAVHPRTLGGRARSPVTEVCLLPVRGRTTHLHRQSFRDYGGGDCPCGGRAKIPVHTRSRCRDRYQTADYAAAKTRDADHTGASFIRKARKSPPPRRSCDPKCQTRVSSR